MEPRVCQNCGDPIPKCIKHSCCSEECRIERLTGFVRTQHNIRAELESVSHIESRVDRGKAADDLIKAAQKINRE